MGRAAANDAPADPKAVMEARRAAYREEQGLPDVKWACFGEQRRHEDFAAVRPSVNMEPYAIDATRDHQTRPWVVSGPNLSRFGPRRGRRGVSEGKVAAMASS